MTISTRAMPFPARGPAPRLEDVAAAQPASPADTGARQISAGVARGEEAAFQELYDLYHRRLFRLALALGQGDDLLARETVQSVFLTAAGKLKPVQSEEHLWNWLARVTRQTMGKSWRQRQRAPQETSLAELPHSAEAIAPDAALEKNVEAALLGLEAEDRQAIEWFYFDGLSHKEIAERMDATPKAVSSRLERARVKLRSLLTGILSHET